MLRDEARLEGGVVPGITWVLREEVQAPLPGEDLGQERPEAGRLAGRGRGRAEFINEP